jgi:hypothetical protein
MSESQRAAMWKKFGPTLKSSEMTRENFIDKLGGARTAYGLGVTDKGTSNFRVVPENTGTNVKKDNDNKPELKNKKKGLDLSSIPSLAEIAAKTSILAQGIENVPENYLKLGRYNYLSQLPTTLRENQLAAQTAREDIRDIVGGDAGKYLSFSGKISAQQLDANQKAVMDDTFARQQILDKNVMQGDEEAKVNTGLQNEYARQRAANRGAYNNMLVSLGQSIDTATDASRLMSSQKSNDAQRLAMLKSMADSGNYDIVTNPDGTISYSVKKTAKGIKKLKTYKRK